MKTYTVKVRALCDIEIVLSANDKLEIEKKINEKDFDIDNVYFDRFSSNMEIEEILETEENE